MVQWQDTRCRCDRSRVRFPEVPSHLANLVSIGGPRFRYIFNVIFFNMCIGYIRIQSNWILIDFEYIIPQILQTPCVYPCMLNPKCVFPSLILIFWLIFFIWCEGKVGLVNEEILSCRKSLPLYKKVHGEQTKNWKFFYGYGWMAILIHPPVRKNIMYFKP